jgi:hypothetical protein
MRIKYSPCHSDKDTKIAYLDENTIQIDDEVYEFDPESVEWPEIAEQTEFRILEAHRDENGELWLVVRRFYTQLARPDWDTGDYHEISRKD